jgi:DNA-binding SARP family transcriptional activator
VQSGQLDAAQFEQLVAEGRRERDLGRRADLLRSALSLFRGEPLSDLRYEDFVREPASRLADQRLAVLEDLS